MDASESSLILLNLPLPAALWNKCTIFTQKINVDGAMGNKSDHWLFQCFMLETHFASRRDAF